MQLILKNGGVISGQHTNFDFTLENSMKVCYTSFRKRLLHSVKVYFFVYVFKQLHITFKWNEIILLRYKSSPIELNISSLDNKSKYFNM